MSFRDFLRRLFRVCGVSCFVLFRFLVARVSGLDWLIGKRGRHLHSVHQNS